MKARVAKNVKNILFDSLAFIFGGMMVIIMTAVLGIAIVWAAVFYWNNFMASPSNAFSTAESINATGTALDLPSGFVASVYAKELFEPSLLSLDPGGHLLVYLSGKKEIVALIDKNKDGISDDSVKILKGVRPEDFYVQCDQAECKLFLIGKNQTTSYDYDPHLLRVSNKQVVYEEVARSNQNWVYVPGGGWPEEYSGNLLAIERKDGKYGVVRFRFDDDGNYMGEFDGEGKVVGEQFISWLDGDNHPASMIVYPNDNYISDLYVSDDQAGLIYRINYKGGQAWRFNEVRATVE